MKKYICFLFSYFILFHLNAQDNSPSDTIGLARSKAYQKDFTDADRLLMQYNIDHSDINALRLHAQVLYWMKEFDRSIFVYEKALQLFPDVLIVQLDYGRVLYELNKLPKARQLLKQYLDHDSTNAEANIKIAYIDLWNGRITAAKKRASFLLQKYPGNVEAVDIMYQINYNTAPYIKAGINFSSDDQPLNRSDYLIEAGVYKSWLFSPVAQATFYQFKNYDSSFHSGWFRLTNIIQLGIGSSLAFGGGIFQQNSNENNFTGSVEFSQKIAKRFLFQAGYEKRPYQYSVASIKNPVLENVSSISLNFNQKNKWLSKAGYEMHHFEDGNNVNSVYFWLLAPIVAKTNFSLSAGYAFSHSNSDKNNFIPAKNITAIINSTPVNGSVQGVYDPYFTPLNQIIHAALASIKIGFSKKIELTSRASIAVSAKADNPALTLKKNGNQYSISKTYTRINYSPLTWVTELKLSLSNKFTISGNYTYDHLLFYISNQGSIQLKYHFLK